ncbi:hypothetical protein [Methylobacterium sp. J-090]|uniref:hypothetical protein n=1 Tax=Methylobacterium sp. J-090 TaxID=2836666 RepID=UPI001FBA64BD|nr:hypothetical protein [Methylobacterium sp. J-090]MCJ2081399.1 hypothetical protein [Methylobacterium sp. J-090]
MDRITRRTLGLAVTLSAVLPGPVQARSSWASGTYVYADLCLTTDHAPAGQRVTLRRSPQGDTLVYEAAVLSGPIQAETIRVDDATRELAFAANADGHPLRFTGTLAVDALTGVIEDETGAHPVRLPRILRPHPNAACPEERTGTLGQDP